MSTCCSDLGKHFSLHFIGYFPSCGLKNKPCNTILPCLSPLKLWQDKNKAIKTKFCTSDQVENTASPLESNLGVQSNLGNLMSLCYASGLKHQFYLGRISAFSPVCLAEFTVIYWNVFNITDNFNWRKRNAWLLVICENFACCTAKNCVDTFAGRKIRLRSTSGESQQNFKMAESEKVKNLQVVS